ncbi:hypothetical protein CCP3SC1AL1_470002 [Gammaproteobacteria bacterium]
MAGYRVPRSAPRRMEKGPEPRAAQDGKPQQGKPDLPRQRGSMVARQR